MERMQDDNELVRAIGNIEGKLDFLIDMVKVHIKDDKVVETRVRSLERWRTAMIAVGTVAGGAAGKVASFFGG